MAKGRKERAPQAPGDTEPTGKTGKGRKERAPQQRALDLYRIVEMMRSGGMTSQDIAAELNRDREPAQQIKAVSVRKQWNQYRREILGPQTKKSAEKLLAQAIEEHEMIKRDGLRCFAQFLADGNPAAPSALMVAQRAQRELDRLRGVQPPVVDDRPGEADTGKPFTTPEEGRAYMLKEGLGGRVLPYADTRRRKK